MRRSSLFLHFFSRPQTHVVCMRQASPDVGPDTSRDVPPAPCFFATLVSCVVASITFSVFAIEPAPIESRPNVVESVYHFNSGSADLEYTPRISGNLFPPTLNMLREAFPVAIDRVREKPECRDLFAQLGSDGLEKLAASMYSRSTPVTEVTICRRGAAAYTYVNTPHVHLCRRFGSLNVQQAAAILIHEALHFAGMAERPADPQGFHPREIDDMVNKACDF